ncbi:replication protein, partial [Lactobacillus reuteri]|nr:replication protein [Limosilactobacillus reuteri]
LTKELTSKRTEKADLTNTNQQLNNQNQQFQNDNQIIQKQINGYKNQLVDTIAENAPEHKVESSLLKPNETAQPVISDTGRQQHLRQTLKYLMDTTTKVLQKIKTEATNFINQITQTLTQPHQDQQSTIIPTPQHSPYLDLLNIKSSDKPFNHRTEKKLMNDPGIKLKKAILFATNDQLQKTSQQTKQSLKKQAEDEYEL